MGEVTYTEVVKTLAAHFHPKLRNIAAAFKCRSCNQVDGETAIDFVTRLKRLTSYCNFGNYLDRTLCKQSPTEITTSEVKKKLLMTAKDDSQFSDLQRLVELEEMTAKEASLAALIN